MSQRWEENAETAILMLARKGGIDGLIALAIVSAQMRARDETARQWERPRTGPEDWIPPVDWKWVSGIAIRHLRDSGAVPETCPGVVAGAYWAAYDTMRDMMKRESRPIALRAATRLRLLERSRGFAR